MHNCFIISQKNISKYLVEDEVNFIVLFKNLWVGLAIMFLQVEFVTTQERNFTDEEGGWFLFQVPINENFGAHC